MKFRVIACHLVDAFFLSLVKIFVLSVGITFAVYIAYQFVSLRSQNSLTTVPHTDCIVILGAAVLPG
jgi:hypothetical protein